MVEIQQKIIQVRRSNVCRYKWCIDRWHKMFKVGRTVVGDKVPEVVLQEYDIEKLSSLCTTCKKVINASFDIDTPFTPTHPPFVTIPSFFSEFWQQICFLWWKNEVTLWTSVTVCAQIEIFILTGVYSYFIWWNCQEIFTMWPEFQE